MIPDSAANRDVPCAEPPEQTARNCDDAAVRGRTFPPGGYK